jgi:hypothetical protein
MQLEHIVSVDIDDDERQLDEIEIIELHLELHEVIVHIELDELLEHIYDEVDELDLLK